MPHTTDFASRETKSKTPVVNLLSGVTPKDSNTQGFFLDIDDIQLTLTVENTKIQNVILTTDPIKNKCNITNI